MYLILQIGEESREVVAESAIKIRVVTINFVHDPSSSTPGELPRKDWSDDEPDLKSI